MGMNTPSQEYESFRMSILKHGFDKGLTSISAIGRHFGYDEQAFLRRMRNMSFDMNELKTIFRGLNFSPEEIANVMR